MSRATYDGRRGLAVLLLLVFGAAGLLLTIRNLGNSLKLLRNADSMQEARGEVLDVIESYNRYGSSYRVLFAFEAGGKRYEGSTDLTGSLSHPSELDRYLSGPPGREHLRVYYLPDDPAYAVLTREPRLEGELFMLVLTAGCLVAGVALFRRGRRGDAPFAPDPAGER